MTDKILNLNQIRNGTIDITLGQYFNQPLQVGIFPEGLKSITFGQYFNQPLPIGIFPEGLESITFKWHFDQPLQIGIFLEGLENITFGENFNQPLPAGIFPKSLKSITFGHDFNQPIKAGTFMEGLTSITFGYKFNQPSLDKTNRKLLPHSLTKLVLVNYDVYNYNHFWSNLKIILRDSEKTKYINMFVALRTLPIPIAEEIIRSIQII